MKLVFFFSFLLLSVGVKAESKLFGSIKNSTNNMGIYAATITLKYNNLFYQLQGISTTDSVVGTKFNGEYSIDDLVEGDYLISISKYGFQPIVDKKIHINKNSKMKMNFLLTPKISYIKKCKDCNVDLVYNKVLIEGDIYDKYSGYAIVGSNIVLNKLKKTKFPYFNNRNYEVEETYFSNTTQKGYYGFFNIEPGLYALNVSATGFEDYNDTIVVKENDRVYKDILLKSQFDKLLEVNNSSLKGIIVGKIENKINGMVISSGKVILGEDTVLVDKNGLFAKVLKPVKKSSLIYYNKEMGVSRKIEYQVYPKTVSFLDISVVPNDLSKYFGEIKGEVKYQNQPIKNAELKLASTQYKTKTDKLGRFEFDSIFLANYYLIAKAKGYKIKIVRIDFGDSNVVNLSIDLDSINNYSNLAKLKFVVSNEDSNFVESAQIRVYNSKFNKLLYTNENGVVDLDSIPIGLYGVKCYKNRYDTTYLSDLDIFDPKTYKIKLKLKKDSFVNLKPQKEYGVIIGEVRDAKSKKSLINSQVVLKSKFNRYFTFTNSKGKYVLNGIKEGKYKFYVSKQGYKRENIDDFEVVKGGLYKNNFSLYINDAQQLAAMEISGSMINNSLGAMLIEKKKSISMDDAISAEDFKKSGGVSSAADAVKQITSVTLKDGRYVYIRGLGDRYVNTLFNGSPVPTPDPDIQAVPMDMFPSGLIDNIVVNKSYLASMPGNFGGGLVNMKSKKFPEDFMFSAYLGGGYVAGETFHNRLSYDGGKLTFLGVDDGTRALPSILKNKTQKDIPLPEDAPYPGDSLTNVVDSYANAFNSKMGMINKKQPLDTKFGINVGNSYKFYGRKIGYLLNLSYKNSYSSIIDGKKGFYSLTDNVDSVSSLSESYLFNYNKGSESVLWGGLLSLNFEFNKYNTFEFNYMHNNIGQDKATYYIGTHYNLSDNQRLETRILKFSQRIIDYTQFVGEHKIIKPKFFNDYLNLTWRFSNSVTKQYEPDMRVFADHFTLHDKFDENGEIVGYDTTYNISLSMYPAPTRFFRNMDETNIAYGFDIMAPLKNPLSENSLNLSMGFSYEKRDRVFSMDKYVYYQKNLEYNGDVEQFFDEDNLGYIGVDTVKFGTRTILRNKYGQYIVKEDSKTDDYKGNVSYPALYFMFELPIIDKINISSGIRFENSNIFVTNYSDTGSINQNDFLLSFVSSYNINEEQKIRASYSNTIVRPSIREVAPFSAVENPKEGAKTGNPELNITKLNNIDLRWEWYYSPKEYFSVGVFYKYLNNPIEYTLLNENGEVSWLNVEKAHLEGVEFEFKKRLFDQIIRDEWRIGGNISLINSNVDIDKSTYNDIIQLDPNASKSRNLQGQAPYVLNFLMTYKYKPLSTLFSLYYNVFGPKLSGIFIGATPNPYQFPENILNFSISQPIGLYQKVKFTAKNLLQSSYMSASVFKDKNYVLDGYSNGIKLSLTYTYKFDVAKIREYYKKREVKFKNIDVNKRELRLY